MGVTAETSSYSAFTDGVLRASMTRELGSMCKSRKVGPPTQQVWKRAFRAVQLRHLRYERAIRHSLLKMPDHPRFVPWDYIASGPEGGRYVSIQDRSRAQTRS